MPDLLSALGVTFSEESGLEKEEMWLDKQLLLSCRHGWVPAPVDFHHYILLVSVAHASSAGDMMAVPQTPLSRFATQYSCECGTIIYCSVATIPLSGPYSCIVPRSPWTLRVQRL